jgi:molecular chaperone GrpE
MSQFVALRHEVNLQTKATRAQQEQNAETLRLLSEALEELRDVSATEVPEADEAVRPLLKAMVDIYDALALAQREVKRSQENLLPILDELGQMSPTASSSSPGASSLPDQPLAWWARLLGVHKRQQLARDAVEAQAAQLRLQQSVHRQDLERASQSAESVRRALDSILTGYGMSLQRLERALQQHGLEPIATVGERFDPERMEVVEVVTDSGKPGGEVLEEVRRGYFWNGKLFRYAQVRVTK